MSFLGAISFGRSQDHSAFSTGDSTGFICYVQLVLLLLDWMLNTITDNFLRDPLVVLVFFICQVLLLIIALIFYLMTSVNHAMKIGIHAKLLRHHQITIILWVLYTCLAIWWNIWSLKRAWPTAGEHFSFTLGSPDTTEATLPPGVKISDDGAMLFRSSTDSYNDTLDLFADPAGASTPRSTGSTNTPTTPKPAFPLAFTSTPTLSATTLLNVSSSMPTRPLTELTTLPTQAKQSSLSTFATQLLDPKPRSDEGSQALVQTSTTTLKPEVADNNSTKRTARSSDSSKSDSTDWGSTLFDSVGAPLIAVHEEIMKINYTITSILGNDTANGTRTGGRNGKNSGFWSPGLMALYVVERSVALFFYIAYILGTIQVANSETPEDTSDEKSNRKAYRRSLNNNFWGQGTGNDNPSMQNESDSNTFDEGNDFFVRQLEEQDGDPFSNAQYEYQYRYGQAGGFHRRKFSEGDTETEASASDLADVARKDRKKKKSTAIKQKEVGMGKADKRRKSSSDTIRNAVEFWGRTVASGSRTNTEDLTWGDDPKIYTTQSSSMIGMSTFNGGERRQEGKNPATGVSVSMDTVGSGSTDELLVAEVFSRRT